MRKKTLLIGMNNPYSDNPAYALWPDPPGCAGHRLWQMLHARTGLSAEAYRRGFDRVNLCSGPWVPADARLAAEAIMATHRGRRIVVLGAAVRAAFRLPPVLLKPVLYRGIWFRQLPHPSGRCRWYNDPKNRAMAGMLLEEELRR